MYKCPQAVRSILVFSMILFTSLLVNAQTITSVALPMNRTYIKGEVLRFMLSTSEPIIVTGQPYIDLLLDTGGTVRANYAFGTATNLLEFNYTIAENNKDYNGIALATINLNGGTLSGTTNNTALDLTTFNVSASLTAGIQVDAILPSISSIKFLGRSPTARTEIPFKVKFNRPVTGVDINDFAVNISTGTSSATITAIVQDSLNEYRVLVSSINIDGNVKLDLKNVATGIQDLVGNQMPIGAFTAGTVAVKSASLTPTIDIFGPTTGFAGSTIDFFGNHFAMVSKVFFGNKLGLITSNTDSSLSVLIMPGSDSVKTKIKLLYGLDTLKTAEDYLIQKSNFPIKQIGEVLPTSTIGNSLFSSSMVVNGTGDFAVVGGPGDNSNAGAIWMYTLQSGTVSGTTTYTWVPDSTKITQPISGWGNANFGSALAMNQNTTTLVVGAPSYNVNKGAIAIYKIINTAPKSIVLDTTFVSNDVTMIGESFGKSLAVSADGKTLLVGANDFGEGNGKVYVFYKTFAGWTRGSNILIPEGASIAKFGTSIALSTDGNTAVISAPQHNFSGVAWVFKKSSNVWSQFGRILMDSSLTDPAQFGYSVAITPDAKNIFIGAPNDSSGKGAVYNYKATDTSYIKGGTKWTYPSNDNNSRFGSSIATNGNGDIVFMSAPNFGASNTGALYAKVLDSVSWTNSIGPALYRAGHLGDKIALSATSGMLLVSDYENNTGSMNSLIPNNNIPIYKSINHNIYNIGLDGSVKLHYDSLIVKILNASSITNATFNDTTLVNYQTLTDSTVLILVDSASMIGKNVLDFRYGVQHIKSDSLLVDLTVPRVRVTFNTTFISSGTYTMTLTFSEFIDTSLITRRIPFIPNVIYSTPMASMSYLREVTPGRVYESTIAPLNVGPISFMNENYGTFYDLAENALPPFLNTDTVIYDPYTIPPPAFTPLPNQAVYDSLQFVAHLPEMPAPGTVLLTFTPATGASVYWHLKDTTAFNFKVKPLTDPTTVTNQVTMVSGLLTAGTYTMTLSYQDIYLNPTAMAVQNNIYIKGGPRDSIVIYSYGTGYNRPNGSNDINYSITVKGTKFTDIQQAYVNDTVTRFTVLTDSTLTLVIPQRLTTGRIKFVNSLGDTSINILNTFYANSNLSASTEKVWLKITPTEMGAIDSLTLFATNISASNISYVLDVSSQDLDTTIANPNLKFNYTIFSSDTSILNANVTDAPLVFKFKNNPYVINRGTDYYVRLRQINNDAIHPTLKSKAGNDAGSNNVFVSIKHNYAMKSVLIMDTIRPVGRIINTNRKVRGPYYVDILFNEFVSNYFVNDIVPSASSLGPTATIDSTKTIIPGIQYRLFITPKLKGPVVIFNLNDGLATDRAFNASLALGSDTVQFVTPAMAITNYTTGKFGLFTSGRLVDISGAFLSNTNKVKIGRDSVPFTINSDASLSLQIPFIANSGKITLYDMFGDSSVQVGMNNNTNALDSGLANNAFMAFAQTYPGVIDTIGISMQNSTSSNLKYIVEFYNRRYDTDNLFNFYYPAAISDTLNIPSNSLRTNYRFGFKQNILLFKDTSYYFRVQQVGTNQSVDAKIYYNATALGLGKVNNVKGNIEFTTSQYPYIIIDTVKPNLQVDHYEKNYVGNAVSTKIIRGPYSMIVSSSKFLDNFYTGGILPIPDSDGQPTVRIDSIKARNEGYIYEYFITPLKLGKIVFFNDTYGIGMDFAGNYTNPLGFDTITYAAPYPTITSYETRVFSAGQLVNLKGKNLKTTTAAKINGVNAQFSAESDTTMIIEVPMHAGTGKILLYNIAGDSSVIKDSNFNWASNTNIANKAWQKLPSYNTGVLDSLSVKLTYTGAATDFKFIAKVYNKDLDANAINANDKFSNPIVISDTLNIRLGASSPSSAQFSFEKYKALLFKDSSAYFVIEQLSDIAYTAKIYYNGTLSGNGAAGANRGNIAYATTMYSYLYVDTLKPIGILSLMQENNKVYGKFKLILGFNKPIQDLSPNPVIVNPYIDQPRAVLDSIETLVPNLLFALHYTPKYAGLLTFQNPFEGVARDLAGNSAEPIVPFNVLYIDTTNHNIITANKFFSICQGDSINLSVNVDSAIQYKWSNGATTSTIKVKTAGKYAVSVYLDSTIKIISDTINIVINPIPSKPIITKLYDSLLSNVSIGNMWYRNDSLISDTTKKIKSTLNTFYKSKTVALGCISEFSDAVLSSSIDFTNKAIILGATSFCAGDSVTLKVKYDSVSKYIWSNGATTSILKVKAGGKYAVYIEFDSTHKIYSDTINIVMTPAPNAPIITRVADTLKSDYVTGNLWYSNGTLLADTANKIKPTASNSYSLRTIQNGCVSTLSNSYYYLITDIINISSSEFIQVAPNPFSDKLNIKFSIKGSAILSLDVLEIATGQIVYVKEQLVSGTQLNLSALNSGLFAFRFYSKDGKTNQIFKILKL